MSIPEDTNTIRETMIQVASKTANKNNDTTINTKRHREVISRPQKTMNQKDNPKQQINTSNLENLSENQHHQARQGQKQNNNNDDGGSFCYCRKNDASTYIFSREGGTNEKLSTRSPALLLLNCYCY